MKTKKILGIIVAFVLVIALSVGATIAWLTDSDEVKNTFTVGNVEITMDEPGVENDPYYDEEGEGFIKPNEEGNGYEYTLIPGLDYTKDPTVTVLKGSSDCYVRAFVTVNEKADLDAIFAAENMAAYLTEDATGKHLDISKVIELGTDWTLEGMKVVGDTRVYELRYKDGAKITDVPDDADLPLSAIFTKIMMPEDITATQLQTIKDLEITVQGQAIQADGFTDADAAWAEIDG